ncbi:MAG TPA: polysaccharide deacetylase family protein [Gemmataceae bacterium]|nr:polysaccharide deacetylase family protein [Gemmataceae bacterium]
MTTPLKNAAFAMYKYSGLMGAQERIAHWSGRRFMSVVVFHRVTDAIPPDGLTVATAWFRGFCALMRDRFNVVTLSELNRLLITGTTPPRRTVAITFDDCYRDNLFAARVLAEHGLPATFFVPTRYVDTDHVFPWDAHLKRMPNLTWDDVREMRRLGHDFESHTASHVDLGTVGPDEARSELAESKRTLEDTLGRPVRFLAYPYGGRNNFRPEYLPLARSLGYEACFSCFGGFIEPRRRGHVLPREAMPYFRSLTQLEIHLSGCMGWYHQLKRRVGLL